MPKRGDVVLIPFPFSDLSGQKIRPAIVLSTDKKANDVVLVFITAKAKTAINAGIIPILPTKQNGLKVASHIVCGKIATLDKKTILGSIGSIDKTTESRIDTALKQLLGLS